MGNTCMKKFPDVEIKIDGKKCVNLKKLLCCNSKCLEDDECVLNCCVVQNITNDERPAGVVEPKLSKPPVLPNTTTN